MSKLQVIVYNIARFVAAIILLQTLYFKFTGSAESIYIFKMVGLEPWGRIGIGVCELIAAVLLLFKRTAWAGSIFALGLMAGAIWMHLTKLGVVVQEDGGYLFFLSIVVALCSAFVLSQNKDQILSMLRTFLQIQKSKIVG